MGMRTSTTFAVGQTNDTDRRTLPPLRPLDAPLSARQASVSRQRHAEGIAVPGNRHRGLRSPKDNSRDARERPPPLMKQFTRNLWRCELGTQGSTCQRPYRIFFRALGPTLGVHKTSAEPCGLAMIFLRFNNLLEKLTIWKKQKYHGSACAFEGPLRDPLRDLRERAQEGGLWRAQQRSVH